MLNTQKNKSHSDNNMSNGLDNSYIKLIAEVINHLDLKDKDGEIISVPFTSDQMNLLQNKGNSLEIKRFCSTLRFKTDSPFRKNLIELLIYPISRAAVLQEEDAYLTPNVKEKYTLYKNLLSDDSVRESMLEYIHFVLQDDEGITSSYTTLKSFQEDPVVVDLLENIKNNTTTMLDRHQTLAIFLEGVQYEVTHNSTGKRSKSRIVNFLIDRLAKSGLQSSPKLASKGTKPLDK